MGSARLKRDSSGEGGRRHGHHDRKTKSSDQRGIAGGAKERERKRASGDRADAVPSRVEHDGYPNEWKAKQEKERSERDQHGGGDHRPDRMIPMAGEAFDDARADSGGADQRAPAAGPPQCQPP